MQLIRYQDMLYPIEQENDIRDFCEKYENHYLYLFLPKDVKREVVKTWWSKKVNKSKHEIKYIYHIQTIDYCDRNAKPVEHTTTASYTIIETRDINTWKEYMGF